MSRTEIDDGYFDHSMLKRPPSHFTALSMEMKWETTRRHPLYIWLSDTWQCFVEMAGADAPTQFSESPGVQLAWVMLDINGLPPSPSLDFDDLLQSDVDPRWLKRSARPVSYRTLAKILQSQLSSDGLRLLSTMLFDASKTEVATEGREQRLMSLNNVDWDELDALVEMPLLLYNPAAPSKEFVSDLTNLRNEMRQRLGIGDTRTSETDLRKYLAAWDAREGWQRGHYDRETPMKLKDVAAQLQLSAQNAKYAYQRGFQLITGHPFSFANWMRVMGVLQLSKLGDGQPSRVALSRLRQRSSVRGDDDTTLSSNHSDCGTSFLGTLAAEDSFDVDGAIMRIRQCLREGRSTDQILSELDLNADAAPAIEEIRSVIDFEGG